MFVNVYVFLFSPNSAATRTCCICHAQTGDRGLLEEIQCSSQTQGEVIDHIIAILAKPCNSTVALPHGYYH